MAAIDFNAVFDAVSLKLRELYPMVNIYDSEIKQNLNIGDIVVLPITPTDREEMSKRRRQSLTIDITGLFDMDESAVACMTAANEMLENLKLVKTVGGDILHGECVESHIEDAVLNIVMKYSYVAVRQSDGDMMTQIESEVNYG